jgi:hypothetical protein
VPEAPTTTAHEYPEQAALAAAVGIYDFCAKERGDARLLMSMRREDLIPAELGADMVEEPKDLNRPVRQTIEQLSRRLCGRAQPDDLDRVQMASFDLPHGIARP